MHLSLTLAAVCVAIGLVFASWPPAIQIQKAGLSWSLMVVFMTTFIGLMGAMLVREPESLPRGSLYYSILVTAGFFCLLTFSRGPINFRALLVLGLIGIVNGVAIYALQVCASSLGSQFAEFQILLALVMLATPIGICVKYLDMRLNVWHGVAILCAVCGALAIYKASQVASEQVAAVVGRVGEVVHHNFRED